MAERPGRDSVYDAGRGYRVNRATGTPTCVHPFRVGLPSGRYASAAIPLPGDEGDVSAAVLLLPDTAALELPDDPSLLEAWFIAVLRTTFLEKPELVAPALAQAEATAAERFDTEVIVTAMRRVISHELPRITPSTQVSPSTPTLTTDDVDGDNELDPDRKPRLGHRVRRRLAIRGRRDGRARR